MDAISLTLTKRCGLFTIIFAKSLTGKYSQSSLLVFVNSRYLCTVSVSSYNILVKSALYTAVLVSIMLCIFFETPFSKRGIIINHFTKSNHCLKGPVTRYLL